MFRRYFISFTLVLTFLVSFTLPAQQLPRIAVLPFNPEGVSESDASVLTRLFEAAVVNTGVFEVIEQSRAGDILEAQAHTLSGCTDESCAVEIGKLLAAENIILGSVSKLGEMFIVTAKIIDVTTGKNIRADSVQGARIEEMTEQVNILAAKLAGLTYRGSGQEAVQTPEGEGAGEIFVRTDPAGAAVYINGLERGQSPLLLKSIPAGMLLVEARKGPLYASRDITVRPDELIEINLALEAAAGRLFIQTDDTSLAVIIDGKERGTAAEGLFKDIQPGSHELVLQNDERYWKGSFSVEPGKTTELEVYPLLLGTVSWDLPEKATASVTGDMMSAELSGKGEDRLPVGTYRVRVTGPYYNDYTTDLRITADAPAYLMPELEFSDSPEAKAYLARGRIEDLEAERKDLLKRVRALQPRSWVRTTGWICTGIGGACLLTAGVATVVGLVAKHTYDSSDDLMVILPARMTAIQASSWMNTLWYGLPFAAASPFLLAAKLNDDPESAAERERLAGEIESLEDEIAALKEVAR